MTLIVNKMKNKYLLIFMMGFTAHLFAQCPYELEVVSQIDIDNYLDQHSDCHLLNKLIVKDSMPKILDDLILNLDTIYGININNTKIKDLDFTSVHNTSVFIKDNDSLLSVAIGKDDGPHFIEVRDNPKLSNLTINCKNIQELDIKTESFLTIKNVNTQTKIKRIFSEGNVAFTGEKAKIYDDLQILRNNILKSTNHILETLSIDTINNIFIYNCEEFDVAGIERISKVKILAYSNINNLNILQMEKANLSNLNLALYDCPTVTTLNPFKHCSILSLTLVEMDNVKTLSGINFNTKITLLKLVGNDILEDISAISTVEAFESPDDYKQLVVYENKNLDFCSYKSICYLLTHPEFSIINVHNNLKECDTKEDIIQSCLTYTFDVEEEVKFKVHFVSDYLEFVNLNEIENIITFDVMGRQMRQIYLFQDNLDFTSVGNGIYFVKIVFINKKSKVLKVLKM